MTVHMAIFSYSEKNSRIELEEVTSMVTDMGDGSYDCQKKYLYDLTNKRSHCQ